MGYEAVRGHSRRGRSVGGSYVSAHGRFTDRGAPRRGSSRSIYFPGSRSASVMPTVWVLGGLVGGVILLLVVLTAANMDAPVEHTDVTSVPATVVPARPAAPPQPCFPFQGACLRD